MKAFFKTLEYHFSVKSTKIENAMFPYKTVLSEGNVKKNKVGSTKWTYHKEQNFSSNCFSFLKILLHFKTLLQRVDLMYQLPKCPYSYFS